MTPKEKLAPVHPGEILREEFMQPLGLSQTRLGRDLGVSPRRINEIVHGKRSITADTALRLSRFFGTSPEFWLGLQADYGLEVASDRLSEKIVKEVKVFCPAEEVEARPAPQGIE
jgi:antitoxin HigA-1